MKVRTRKRAYLGRVKVYGKGVVNIPKEALEVSGIGAGDSVVLSAVRGRIELRKARNLEELAGSLKGLKVSEEELKNLRSLAFSGLRNAFADAYEFFEDIKEGIPYSLEVGEYYNKVYLAVEQGDLRKSIHISYVELPKYPNGIITIDGGIKEFLESEQERKVVEANKEKIEKALSDLNLEEFGENGYLLLVEPEFSRKESAYLSVIIERLKGVVR